MKLSLFALCVIMGLPLVGAEEKMVTRQEYIQRGVKGLEAYERTGEGVNSFGMRINTVTCHNRLCLNVAYRSLADNIIASDSRIESDEAYRLIQATRRTYCIAGLTIAGTVACPVAMCALKAPVVASEAGSMACGVLSMISIYRMNDPIRNTLKDIAHGQGAERVPGADDTFLMPPPDVQKMIREVKLADDL